MMNSIVLLSLTGLLGTAQVPATEAECTHVLLPLTSGCHRVLLARDYHSFAAYSVQAESYFETEDKRLFAAQVTRELVSGLAKEHPACQVELVRVCAEAIECQRFGRTSTVCQVPSDSGSLIVVKDYVDRAALIYRPAREEDQTPAFGFDASVADEVSLPDPGRCYEALFVKSAVSKNGFYRYPGPHGDHQTHYVRLPGEPSADIRLWALQHVHALVRAHARAGQGCAYQPLPFSLGQADCRLLGGIPVCSLAAEHGGYFIVTFDELGAAEVVFNRWD